MASPGACGFVVALLGTAGLQGCGGWTQESYCKEKVKVECENFDQLYEKKKAKSDEQLETIGVQLHKASALRFYNQCKDEDEGWGELRKQCQGEKCAPIVDKATNEPHNMGIGRDVLLCIEKSLEKAGFEEYKHPAPKKKTAKKKKELVYRCACSKEGKTKGCEDPPPGEDLSAAKKFCKEEGRGGLWEWACAEKEEHPEPSATEEEAKEFCEEDNRGGLRVEDTLGDTIDKIGLCTDKDGERVTFAAPEPPHNKDNAKWQEACEGAEGCEEEGQECKWKQVLDDDGFADLLELGAAKARSGAHRGSLLEQARNGTHRGAHRGTEPAPRRKRGDAMLLAQDSTRVEVDHSGVAQVRTPAAPRAHATHGTAEVSADGSSLVVAE